MHFLFLAMLLSFTFNSIVAYHDFDTPYIKETKSCGHSIIDNIDPEDKASWNNALNRIGEEHHISDELVDLVFTIHPEFNLITLSHEFAKNHNNAQLKFNAILLTGETGEGKTLAAEAIAKKLNADLSTLHISAFDCWSDTDIEAKLKKQSEQSNNANTPHVIIIDGAGFQNRSFNQCAATRLADFIRNCNDKNMTFIITTDSKEQLSPALEAEFINFPLHKVHTTQNREKILQTFVALKAENGALEYAVQNTADMNWMLLGHVAHRASINASLREANEISQEDFDQAIKAVR